MNNYSLDLRGLHSPTNLEHAAMQQHQSDDLAECERERSIFSTTFSRPFKDQSGEWRNWDLIWSQ